MAARSEAADDECFDLEAAAAEHLRSVPTSVSGRSSMYSWSAQKRVVSVAEVGETGLGEHAGQNIQSEVARRPEQGDGLNDRDQLRCSINRTAQ